MWPFRAGGRASLLAADAQEGVLLGPAHATYMGGTGSYSRVSRTGALLLTRRKLVFRTRTGKDLELPLTEVTTARPGHTGRLGALRGGMPVTVIATARGGVSFVIKGSVEWSGPIRDAVRAASG